MGKHSWDYKTPWSSEAKKNPVSHDSHLQCIWNGIHTSQHPEECPDHPAIGFGQWFCCPAEARFRCFWLRQVSHKNDEFCAVFTEQMQRYSYSGQFILCLKLLSNFSELLLFRSSFISNLLKVLKRQQGRFFTCKSQAWSLGNMELCWFRLAGNLAWHILIGHDK